MPKAIIYFIFFLGLGLSKLVAQDSSILIPGHSLDAQRLFQLGDQAITEKDWLKAIEIYQKIFKNHSKDLVEKEQRLYVNAGYFAIYKITQWPKEAKEAYYNAFIGQATSLLQTSNIEENLAQLVPFLGLPEVQSRILALADQELLRERYSQALSYLQFLRTYGCVQDSASLLARLGICYYILGDWESLEQLRQIMPASSTAFPSLLEKNTTPIPADALMIDGKLTKLTDWFDKLEKKKEERILFLNTNSNWPMLAGNPTRNFRTYQDINIDMLPMGRQIKLISPKRPATKDYINEPETNFRGPQPYYPIVADNMVFIVNGQKVMAYDIFSQQLRWTFAGLAEPLPSQGHEQYIHHASYYQDALYVTVEDISTIQPHNTYKIYYGEYQISRAISKHRLLKLSAQTGEILWTVQDENPDPEAFGNRISFMSAPVMWGEYLYVGAVEFKGMFNAYLVTIHPKSGKIISKTSVISSQQELNMFGRPAREVVGSVVTVGNGFAYYLSNLGACCCNDLLTNQIVWLYVYDRIIVQNADAANYITYYRANGCSYGPPILAGNQIFITPLDSTKVYCLDARYGNVQWKRDIVANSFLLGIRGKRIMLAGGNYIHFWDTQTGAPLNTALFLSESPAGMGLIGDTHLYLNSDASLYAISIEKGIITSEKNIAQSRQFMSSLGHLVFANGVLVSASQDALWFFYDWNQTRLLFEQKIKKNPNTVDCLQLANIYQERGKENIIWLEQSKLMFQKALELSRNNPDYRALSRRGLFQVYLELANYYRKTQKWDLAHQNRELALTLTNVPKESAEILMADYEDYLQTPEHADKTLPILETLANQYGQVNYTDQQGQTSLVFFYAVSKISDYFLQKKQPQQAIEWYQKTLANYGKSSYGNLPATQWVQRQISAIIAQYGRACYQKYDLLANQSYELAKSSGLTADNLQTILQQYPNCQIAPTLHFQLVEILVQKEQYKNALTVLQNFREEYSNLSEQTLALCWMAQCYEKLEEYHRAKSVLENLKKLPQQQIIWQGKTIVVSQWADSKLASNPTYKRFASQEKNLEFDTNRLITKEISIEFGNLIIPEGTPDNDYQNRVFVYGENLTCYNATTGEVFWSEPMPDILLSLVWVGRNLFAKSDRVIWRLNPDNGEMVWRHSLFKKMQDSNVTNYVVFTDKGIVILDYMQKNNQCFLYLRSLEDRSMLWQTGFAGKPTHFAWHKDYVITCTQAPFTCYIHSLTSGDVMQKLSRQIPETGKNQPRWNYYPIFSDTYLYLYDQHEQKLTCYMLPDKAIWNIRLDNVKTSNFGMQFAMLLGNNRHLVFLRANYELVILNINTGEIRQTQQLKFLPQNLVLDEDEIYTTELVVDNQSLWAIDAMSGQVKWIRKIMSDRSSADFLHTTQYLVVLTTQFENKYRSTLLIYDKEKGDKLVEFELPSSGDGRGYPQMTFCSGKLWIQKDKKIWIIGK